MRESGIQEQLFSLSKLDEINIKLHGYSSGYSELKATLEHSLTVFNLAKFSENDKVKLVLTPEISDKKSWGWLGYKHFLVKGSIATVKGRQFYNGHFLYDLVFEDDSRIHFHSKEKIATPLDERGLFSIPESWLEKHEQ